MPPPHEGRRHASARKTQTSRPNPEVLTADRGSEEPFGKRPAQTPNTDSRVRFIVPSQEPKVRNPVSRLGLILRSVFPLAQ